MGLSKLNPILGWQNIPPQLSGIEFYSALLKQLYSMELNNIRLKSMGFYSNSMEFYVVRVNKVLSLTLVEFQS